MLNTHRRFEAKIPYGTKVVAIKMNCTKFLSFKVNLTLKVKVSVKLTGFSNTSDIFR